MPRNAHRRSSPQRLLALLLGVSLPPAAVLVFLSFSFFEQDRALQSQRDLERRQAATPAIVSHLRQSLAEAVRTIDTASLEGNAVRIRFTRETVSVEPPHAAAWLPVPPAMPESDRGSFVEAEANEARNPDAALQVYVAAAKSTNPRIRAGALLRRARVHMRLGQLDEAVAAYRQMASIPGVAVLGAPADVQARRWIVDVLERQGRRTAMLEAAQALEKDLLAHKWVLDGPTWGLIAKRLLEVTGRAVAVPPAERDVSEFADALWRGLAPDAENPSYALVRVGSMHVFAVTTRGPARLTSVLLPPSTVESWTRAASDAAPTRAVVRVFTESDEVWIGQPPRVGTTPVLVSAAEGGLPWAIAIDSHDTSDLAADSASRRRQIWIGLAAALSLVAGATFVLWRVVQREIAVARMQTDFVAAVSHEFRTPLTSLRHVTDLLEENDELVGDRRRQFYRTLGRNTERLHRLVEALLDFSRMETGRKPYALRLVDLGDLTGRVVEEFERDTNRDVVSIQVEVESLCTVSADGEAVTTALWNLLDNAVKYSPGRADIRVAVSRRADGRIALAVSDRGLGVPAREHSTIFGRFVRGAQATYLGIKGTGLGLALVSHIVEAHHGTVELESTEGTGSTFTILLRRADAGSAMTVESPSLKPEPRRS
jgi:signal transduction histidine kinase